MRASVILCLVVGFGSGLQAVQQTATIKDRGVAFYSTTSREEGSKRHFQGSVVIRTDTLEIRSEEAEFNSDSGEVEARRNVSVRPAPAFYLEELISIARSDLAAISGKLTDLHPTVVCLKRKIDTLQLRIQDPSTWSVQTDTLRIQLKRSTC